MVRQAFGMRIGPFLLMFPVMALGLGFFVQTLLQGVMQSRNVTFSLDAPGNISFTLDEPGDYILFAEYSRTQDSQDAARPGGIEWLEVSVNNTADNSIVALDSVSEDEQSYAIRRKLREPLYRFFVDAAGAFQLTAEYPPEEPGPPLKLVLSRSYEGQVFSAVVKGVGILLATICIVGIIIVCGRVPASAETQPVDPV